ncbi:Uncharacterised protein [Bordetella pertussis]|nr:Uncharacterised protein [Bordetella pertussis]CFP57019.1 Uncharacterised protein [Bordetella pertussis]CFW32290.1 Uncharacterised protein [Bordetella pertussis]
MAFLTSCRVALRRFCLTTNRRTPASSQALTMRLPSSQRVAMGFSLTTWRPAWATSMACQGCRPDGVASTSASALPCASMSLSEENGRAPVAASAACSASGLVSQISTSSARSPCCAIAPIWFLEMRPQPTKPKRIFRSVMGSELMNAEGLR